LREFAEHLARVTHGTTPAEHRRMSVALPTPLHLVPLERLPAMEVLRQVEPFTDLRADEAEALARDAVRSRRAAGSALASEGQATDGLYVVLRGRVNLVRSADGGRDLILACLGPGDVFGEACAFEGATMSTSAVAAVPTELLRISPEALAAHLRRCPETALRCMRLMTDKLRDIENVASALALYDVEERLRRTLVRLAARQGRRVRADDEVVLAPVPTQSELARMVGSCRETVSRTLSAMARSGLVAPQGRRLVLLPALLDGARA
jgi:CRP-like cAMP-binding protein